MFRPNKLKQKLARGEKAIGAWLSSTSADMAEILARAGFEAFMIDHEHGAGNLVGAIEQHRAVSSVSDATVLMRVPANDPVLIKRALDTGIDGLMVPLVNTADEARAAVEACRYPPNGGRGAGFGAARAGGYGIDAADYRANIEDNLLIICQIETKQAVENIEEIAAVDGVDMLFIGPNDLSGSINLLAQHDHPDVIALFNQARDRIKNSKAFLGCISKGPEQTNKMLEEGFDFLICASDTGLVAEGAKRILGAVRL